jgi:hypothetical protein
LFGVCVVGVFFFLFVKPSSWYTSTAKQPCKERHVRKPAKAIKTPAKDFSYCIPLDNMNICREFQSFKKVLHFTEDPTKKSLLMSASQIDALVHTQKKKKSKTPIATC